jgi:DUF3102 family protein
MEPRPLPPLAPGVRRDPGRLSWRSTGTFAESWRETAASIIETGKRLIEAKAEIGHGGWLAFIENDLKRELGFSLKDRAVDYRMKLFKRFGDSHEGANLLPSESTLLELARLPMPTSSVSGRTSPRIWSAATC